MKPENTTGAHPPAASATNVAADVVVIGAGIIGTACALALSRQGLRVVVLDSQPPGMGASYGNAGHMATEQVFPIADAAIVKQLPKMLRDPMGPLRLDWRYMPKALPWFTRLLWNLRPAPYQASVAGIRALNEQSLAAWQRLLDSVDSRHLLKEEGSFLVYEKADAADELEVLRARMVEQQVPVEGWTGDAIRDVAPQLSDNIQGGLFFPSTAHVINPWQVVNSLVQAAEANGVELRQSTVLTGHVNDQGVTLKTDNASPVTASKVVLACGAHSAKLAAALTGIRPPLDTERGYHLMLPNERGRLPVAVTSLERRFIMTPMDEGLRLAGTVEFAGLKRQANMQRAWQLHKLSQGLFRSELDSSDAKPWMGFRPSLPDSLPIIDSVKDGKVLLAFGHHHLGLTQAALTAEIIADLAASSHSQRVADLSPYRLSRFS
ncbi:MULTISPECIES: FAD-dependent oxidoreductase [unclassified Halomonas]|uniref:FAD-dependent oxidoreductase n=1 Tax=unclassified Halomonas TaxID=2609666 RepID=UPI0007DA1C7D|nr:MULTISPECIES: FAD-dependent oxidoreductase [unclassified Halomonas]MBT2785176.1 FAD-binding oxidoreductase [Halomonas sp. ISL-106]MBT2796870.1 FAD-binding oxidoreductase [Halomonas sp. ISL-104]OAL60092.1 FAD-dependent oxidoreductase [Halomonas sp. ALS9]